MKGSAWGTASDVLPAAALVLLLLLLLTAGTGVMSPTPPLPTAAAAAFPAATCCGLPSCYLLLLLLLGLRLRSASYPCSRLLLACCEPHCATKLPPAALASGAVVASCCARQSEGKTVQSSAAQTACRAEEAATSAVNKLLHQPIT
jgi:hypothetical protein